MSADDLVRPFLLDFAEPLVERHPPPRLDVTRARAALVGPLCATGRRDKVLLITCARDAHADSVAAAVWARGSVPCRLDVDDLGREALLRLSWGPPEASSLVLPVGELHLEEVKSVWLRRPALELLGLAPAADAGEAFARRETDAALRGLFALLDDRAWLNRPAPLMAALSKPAQLTLAQRQALRIPRTLITSDPHAARRFWTSCQGDVVIKAFRGELVDARGTQLLFTQRLSADDLSRLERLRAAPCILQEYVPKASELRVTFVGDRAFAVEITSDAGAPPADDWRRPAEQRPRYRAIPLPPELETPCRAMLRDLQLQFGAFDFIRRPDGEYVFLEINPQGDWMWLEALTGVPITDAIAAHLHAAA